jgi:23S rRNA (guanine2445-N2)-methyltransferase / 23S rRNA (guanine2069-N7)-methyltransferase
VLNASPVDTWFATCPKGLESLLAAELLALGAQTARETVAGVSFSGPRALAYRACLWSRLANRVLWPLGDVPAADADGLYESLRALDWGKLFASDVTIAVDFSGENRGIRNTRFGAQRSKDAVVDWFVDSVGSRPSVDRREAQVRINVRLTGAQARVSLDLSGASLHRRGYRQEAGAAPLKENLAAALLLRADWPGIAARGGALIDPMCGSGTLLIEGAMMAADMAPGLLRRHYGFEYLKMHDATQWQAILSDAKGRAERGRSAQLPEMRGYDIDARMVRRAQENVARLDLDKHVRITSKSVDALVKPTHKPLDTGLLICNPPYGERLGERATLPALYAQLGRTMVTEFPGWKGAVFTPDLDLGKATGLRSHKRYTFYNGAIETLLLLFDLQGNELRTPAVNAPLEAAATPDEDAVEAVISEGAQMFGNRLRKNRKRLSSWLKRDGVECYRLYDADMPEYAVAVDVYGDHIHVAEYQAPKTVSEEAAQRRMAEIQSVLPQVLDVDPKNVVYKQRRRQRGTEQYGKHSSLDQYLKVPEGKAQLLVNLHDYLDTGLFLDHRPLRLRIAGESAGKDFLNLFCYTGTATVHAALGGASSTTSIDTSNTYLEWLGKNLAANNLPETSHRQVKSDVLKWLAQEKDQYDIMLVDPPSFSNSKSRDDSFDVQRDHLQLLEAAMARLRKLGTLYFSNNLRGFALDDAVAQMFDCVDITGKTLDPDFQRGRKIHQCWQIRHRL